LIAFAWKWALPLALSNLLLTDIVLVIFGGS